MEDRTRLTVSIAVLAVVTAINAGSGRSGLAVLCGTVLGVVVIVRLVVPGLRAVRAKRSHDG